ncbi:hypothetical protein HaLaN_22074, partial [Haematococcus lacustris]
MEWRLTFVLALVLVAAGLQVATAQSSATAQAALHEQQQQAAVHVLRWISSRL